MSTRIHFRTGLPIVHAWDTALCGQVISTRPWLQCDSTMHPESVTCKRCNGRLERVARSIGALGDGLAYEGPAYVYRRKRYETGLAMAASKALVALLLALTPTLAHAQGLYHLGFTLDGRPGPGWVETPLGVVTEYDVLLWRLTLRGMVPVAEILREREVGRG